jgi:hypothetical protein
MTLAQLSEALSTNANLMVSLVDSKGDTLIRYTAAGYEAVDSAIMARKVSKVIVNGNYSLSVVIADAE